MALAQAEDETACGVQVPDRGRGTAAAVVEHADLARAVESHIVLPAEAGGLGQLVVAALAVDQLPEELCAVAACRLEVVDPPGVAQRDEHVAGRVEVDRVGVVGVPDAALRRVDLRGSQRDVLRDVPVEDQLVRRPGRPAGSPHPRRRRWAGRRTCRRFFANLLGREEDRGALRMRLGRLGQDELVEVGHPAFPYSLDPLDQLVLLVVDEVGPLDGRSGGELRVLGRDRDLALPEADHRLLAWRRRYRSGSPRPGRPWARGETRPDSHRHRP